MRGKTAIKRAHASLKARKRTSEASFAKPSRRPTLTDIHKKRRSKERRLLILVELMRKTANSTGTANRSAIQLDTCIVRVSKNWFVVVGTCQK